MKRKRKNKEKELTAQRGMSRKSGDMQCLVARLLALSSYGAPTLLEFFTVSSRIALVTPLPLATGQSMVLGNWQNCPLQASACLGRTVAETAVAPRARAMMELACMLKT